MFVVLIINSNKLDKQLTVTLKLQRFPPPYHLLNTKLLLFIVWFQSNTQDASVMVSITLSPLRNKIPIPNVLLNCAK